MRGKNARKSAVYTTVYAYGAPHFESIFNQEAAMRSHFEIGSTLLYGNKAPHCQQ